MIRPVGFRFLKAEQLGTIPAVQPFMYERRDERLLTWAEFTARWFVHFLVAIERIVTLNADDLLEQIVSVLTPHHCAAGT